MRGLEALQSVQYVTVEGKRYAVLSVEDWEALVEWLEDIEDVRVAEEELALLRACDGDRQKAGWLRWDQAREQVE